MGEWTKPERQGWAAEKEQTDFDRAVSHARAAQERGEEISDECARVIGALYHGGQASIGYAFTSTGALPDNTGDLCRDLFGPYDGPLTADERLLFDMLGTYGINREHRGPVVGWSRLWL